MSETEKDKQEENKAIVDSIVKKHRPATVDVADSIVTVHFTDMEDHINEAVLNLHDISLLWKLQRPDVDKTYLTIFAKEFHLEVEVETPEYEKLFRQWRDIQ